jgi:hypothetical protein
MVLATSFHKSSTSFYTKERNSEKVNKYGRIISANRRQRRQWFIPKSPAEEQKTVQQISAKSGIIICVVSEGKIIQARTTVAHKVGEEVFLYCTFVLNHHHYPLRFQRGLC